MVVLVSRLDEIVKTAISTPLAGGDFRIVAGSSRPVVGGFAFIRAVGREDA
jgi:hypothetical protein